MGYQLEFDPFLTSNVSIADICIVDVSRIKDCQSVLQQGGSPYLISGVNASQMESVVYDLPIDSLKNSVGFINGSPALADICINIHLGLLWHEERQTYSQRVQNIDDKISNNRTTGVAIGLLMNQSGMLEKDVMDCLKSVSRDKRRRMVDVSRGIIDLQQKLERVDISTLEKLKVWLSSVTPSRSSCVEG